MPGFEEMLACVTEIGAAIVFAALRVVARMGSHLNGQYTLG